MGSCKVPSTEADKAQQVAASVDEENKRRQVAGQPLLDQPPPPVAVCPSNSGIDDGAEDGELPQHLVRIEHPFQMEKATVTLGQFKRFLATRGDLVTRDFMRSNHLGDNMPVVWVGWEDAQAFVDWLNKSKPADDPGLYRLPTEAEWEYAARAGTTTKYWWGDDIGSGNANCGHCGSQWDIRQTAPVASFKPNAFGLFDMLGNVWQWVEDCYHHGYAGAPTDGTAWATEGCNDHISRGGAWDFVPRNLRAADRFSGGPDFRFRSVGFRLVRTL